jgi:hypothetical protein
VVVLAVQETRVLVVEQNGVVVEAVAAVMRLLQFLLVQVDLLFSVVAAAAVVAE